MTTRHRARATAMIVVSVLCSAGAAMGQDGARGLPACPDVLTDGLNCHLGSTALPALFSNEGAGAFRTAEDVRPTASNPTRLCWLGRYADRQDPAVMDESFRVRIYANDQGLPDLGAGPIFDRTFSQSGAAGQDLLELGCLDGQSCPGTTSPASGGHFVYSVEVAGGLPMVANACYYVEITCIGSAAAGRSWAWSASQGGSDLTSYQAPDGQYTLFTTAAYDRALCVSGGVNPFLGLCGPTIPPQICVNESENGQWHDGVGPVIGLRSSSMGSVGNPDGPGAWTPVQRAENFQVAAPAVVTSTCFDGFYTAVNCEGIVWPPDPTHDITFFADVDGLPGGPAPIASFRLGTTPGVSYVWDGGSYVSATHPPVALEPGRCYWLSISREQSDSAGCHSLWHWQLTASTSPAADRVLASRDVTGGTPGAWQPEIVQHEGDTAISNFVYLFNAGPVVAPVCGDCNVNGVADAAEISGNMALDCFDRSASYGRGSADGLLDSCQCAADWDRDGAVNSSDISAYLVIWLDDLMTTDTPADVDCDGVTNSNDISAFLSRWLASVTGQTPLDGCP